jgi:hypothetical protein
MLLNIFIVHTIIIIITVRTAVGDAKENQYTSHLEINNCISRDIR